MRAGHRRSLSSRVVVLALAASGLGAGGPKAVEVESDRNLYAPGEQAKLRVVNDTGEALFAPGCRPFELHVFSGDAFRVHPWKKCEHEGVATRVQPGGTEIPFPVPAGSAQGVFRAVFTYGRGCREGLPLSQASCKTFETRISHSFRVGKVPE